MLKPKIKVNNKLRGSWGETKTTPGKRAVIQINVKKHKTDKFKKRYDLKTALADTIHHELMHAQHPKMHEKTVYKKTAKTMKFISKEKVNKLVAKLKQGKFE